MNGRRTGAALLAGALPGAVYWATAPNWLHLWLPAGATRVYIVTFSLLLALVVLLFSRRRRPPSLGATLTTGVVAGIVCTLIADITCVLTMRDGLERLANSYRAFGLVTLLQVHALAAFTLGGWIFGMAALLLARASIPSAAAGESKR